MAHTPPYFPRPMLDIFHLNSWLGYGLAAAGGTGGAWILRLQSRNMSLQRDIRSLREEMARIIADAGAAQKEASEARQKAETANAAKSDFLANTSHEIRTPMNAILGMTRLLLDSPLTAEQQSWAGIVRDSGENLLAILNDILDLSKIEAGRMVLARESFDLCQTLASVTDLLIYKAEQKNISLIVDIAPDVPRFVMGDALRIKQIALNLLSNAVKFTSEGYVKLDVRKALATPSGENYLFLEVHDTGTGIPSDKLRYIFDKFTQAEESTTRHFGGTGLGLAITHKLVQMMKGTVAVESMIGQGSHFTVSIPLPPAPSPKSRLPDADLRGKRLLLLTEDPMIAGVVSAYADDCGLQIEVSARVFDVLDALLAAEKRGDSFDFILIDHGMGGVRLLELIDRIRVYPAFEDIDILAVATLGSATATRLLNSNRIAALLSRPLFPDQFEDTLKILVNARERGTATGTITRNLIEKMKDAPDGAKNVAPSFEGANILVVEDIEVNQILMAKLLQKLGCKSEAAMSGKEAIAKVREKTYDLIFMDGHMPEMDGIEATRRIRLLGDEAGRHAIIVALTADAMSGDQEKYLAAGMNDYLNKPVTPERIAAMLNKWVARG